MFLCGVAVPDHNKVQEPHKIADNQPIYQTASYQHGWAHSAMGAVKKNNIYDLFVI